ncbi:MAG TPA: aminopeptidase P N-terminal domain-containing protein, partial [Terriglobales bacterium]|nr:aminopeptidase P N-terminal domain-containing protein [Terriglobales bacterium]
MRRLLIFALLFINLAAFAQYTDMAAINDLGGPQEFARRRTELAKQLKTGYTLLWARINEPEAAPYREDNDFYYYTGLQDQGAILLINNQSGEVTIFEPQQPPRVKQVYGPNLLGLNDADRKSLGYDKVFPMQEFDWMMSRTFGRENPPELWVRLGFADKADGARSETATDYAQQNTSPLGDSTPGDRSAIIKLRERYPAVKLNDLTQAIDAMRLIKTPGEIAVLRRNGKISAEGNRRAIAKAKPGMYEYQVEAEARYWYAFNGAQGIAYPAIVGSGPNSNTWHYFQDRRQMQPNEIVVFDFAADLDHETM